MESRGQSFSVHTRGDSSVNNGVTLVGKESLGPGSIADLGHK